LDVNGEASEQTVAAAEQRGRALGLRAKVLPRWGELQLKSEDKDGELISLVAADPTGVDMDRVACAVRAMEELGGDRLTPETAAATAGAIASAPPAPTWLFTLAAGAGAVGAFGDFRRRASDRCGADIRERRCRRHSASGRGPLQRKCVHPTV